jgi:hypothetical protein
LGIPLLPHRPLALATGALLAPISIIFLFTWKSQIMPCAIARKLCTGMNGQCWFGGMSPQAYLAFSLEEAPTCGRGSSLPG